ncbi:MAG: hypothetical protein ACYDH9_26500 [Limisphaerales bacterium]
MAAPVRSNPGAPESLATANADGHARPRSWLGAALPGGDAEQPAAKDSFGTPRLHFTLDGNDRLEKHLAGTCQKILAGVRGLVSKPKLEALLLGGGYGRGEGGVLRTPDGDRPYNDLEFYVSLRGNDWLNERRCLRGNDWLNERRYQAGLHALGEILTPAAGVEVEFKILSLARLRRSSVTMFYYDLMMGHRWLLGDETLLAGCEHHRMAADIPLAEATRLMMNRCSGLLFAQEKLDQPELTSEAADFIARNQAKARLAFGDVVLARHGQYHWSCRERHRRLQALLPYEARPWLAEVRRGHEEGVKFKLHPQQSGATRETLQDQQETLVALALPIWLWLENHRLGETFTTPSEYAFNSRDKCPETNAWRNRMVNAKVFGVSGPLAPTASRYPRERLLNALALLLWEPAAVRDPASRRLLQTALCTPAADFPGCVAAYRSLWRRFN